MHHHTCSKAELQVSDRVLDIILAAWQKWQRFSLAVLRLAVKRKFWNLLGNQFRCSKEQGLAQQS